jgi:large repetitive protein
MLTQQQTFRFWAVFFLSLSFSIIKAQKVTITAPKDITVECNLIPKAQNPIATTTCENKSLSFAITETKTNGNCTDAFVLTRQWTVKDACNNTATVSQKITVRDSRVPTIGTIPTNVTVDCNKIPAPAKVTATDNCDKSVEIAVNDKITAGLCTDSYLIARTWTATDNCGNKNTKTQLISVRDLTRPVLMNVPVSLTVSCEAIPVKANPTATDNCDKEVSITFNESKMNVRCENSFTLKREWTASDNCGNNSKQTQFIIVQDTKNPTFTTIPATLTVDCVNIQGSSPLASDNCDTSLDVIYKETLLGTSTTTPNGCTYRVLREWSAVDNCNNRGSTSQTLVVQDTKAPKFTSSLPDMTVSCTSIPSLSINPSAVDNCDTKLTYTVKETIIQGQGLCADNYTIRREWTATDKCGNSATTSQLISVEDKLAPVIVGIPSNLTMSCSQLVPAIATNVGAMDNCDKQLDITFKETKVNGNCTDTYTIRREWTATDNCGNKGTRTQTIVLRDVIAPTFTTIPQNITVDCDKIPTTNVKAIDNCDKDVLITMSETKENGNCPDNFTIRRVWTATDNCGNSKTTAQVIVVRDRTAPKFTSSPNNVTVECNSIPLPAVLTAVDNCDKEVAVDFSTTKVNGTCPQNYQILNSWTATDNCNNVVKWTQRIQVNDTQSPILDVSISIPTDLTAECKTVPPPAKLKFVDNCDTDIFITYNEETSLTQDACNKKLVRTWIAKDDCNNTKIISHSIFLIDNEAPIFSTIPANITANCDAIPPAAISAVSVTDNCTSNVKITVKDYEEIDSCKKTITRLWTATDDCGNTAFATQTINVIDNTPPYVVSPPNLTINLACGAAVPPPPAVMFKDKCNDNVKVSYSEEITDGTSPNCPITKLIRRWRATDPCGNATVFVQTLFFGTNGGTNRIVVTQPTVIIDKDKAAPQVGGFLAYPNPTNGLINVNLSAKADEVIITDELGRTVALQQNCSNALLAFDLSREMSGIYFLTVKTGTTLETQKIVLVKQ